MSSRPGVVGGSAAPSAGSAPSAPAASSAPSAPAASSAPEEGAPGAGSAWAAAASALLHAEQTAGLRSEPASRRRRQGPRTGEGPAAAPEADAASAHGQHFGDRPVAGAESTQEAEARAIVMRQLAMTARSRGQLEVKLRQRGCDDDVAARVLDRVTELGLIDDGAYAGMLVRDHHSSKGLARGALAHELRKRGIDSGLAEVALAQVGAADERRRAEQLAAKKLRSMGGLTPDVQARRLGALLARKGYPGEIAWPVVRDAIAGAPEHQRD